MASLWCAHKAYCRGLLIQAAVTEKRKRAKLLNNLLTELKSLGQQHKQNLSPQVESDLFDCRQKICLALISAHQKYMKLTKARYYVQGNKAGKLLANYIKKR